MFVQKSGFHQKTVKHGNVNIKNSNFPPKRMDLTIKNGEDWRFKPQNVGIYPLVNVYTTNWKITIFNGKTMGKPWENGDFILERSTILQLGESTISTGPCEQVRFL